MIERYVFHRSASGRKDCFDRLQNMPRLNLHVALANEVTIAVERKRAGRRRRCCRPACLASTGRAAVGSLAGTITLNDMDRALPPYQHRSARRGVLRTQGRRRPRRGRADMDGLRGRTLERNLLQAIACSGPSGERDRARPSRRVYIPKPDGRQRPLAVAALEDKIVQRATGSGAERDLRGRLPRVLRVPAWTRRA